MKSSRAIRIAIALAALGVAGTRDANAAMILDVNLASLTPGSSWTTTAYNGATGTVTLTGSTTPVAGTTTGGLNDSVANSWENQGVAAGYNSGAGAANNLYFSEVADGTAGDETAVWQFTGLTSGYYSVHVTYVPLANRTTAAPYQVYDGTTGGTLLTSLTVNQEVAPNDLTVNDGQGSHSWELLSASATITSGILTVRLSDVANSNNLNFVIADAVRIDYLGPIEVIPAPAAMPAGLALMLAAALRRRRR